MNHLIILDIPTQYCESQIEGFLSQPLNTFSNVAFLIAAFLANGKIRNLDVRRHYILPVLLAFVGVCSAWWHITNSQLGNTLDTLSIFIFASIATIQLLSKIATSNVVTVVVFILLLALILITERIAAWNGSLPYVVLLVSFGIGGFIYLKKFALEKGIFISAFHPSFVILVELSQTALYCQSEKRLSFCTPDAYTEKSKASCCEL